MMGSTGGTDRERPVHQVTVGSFSIGKYEVTQKEWTEVMGSNPSNFNGATLPVEQVDWYDAIAYCNKRSVKEGLTLAYTINGQNVTWDKSADGYRLPTEAEWEYAARGGKNSSAPFTYAAAIRWAMSPGIVKTVGTGHMRQGKKRPMRWDYMT
jgi:formylglycine-generating enzyme required for sulfatase activity